MSGYHPQHNDLPQSYEPMVSVSSLELRRSGSLRTTIGVSCLILTAAAVFYTVLDLSLLGHFSGAAAAVLAISAAGYAVGAAAYLGIGIWVLVTRKATSKAPLIAAAVIAGIAVILLLLGLAAATAAGSVPRFGALALNLLVLMRAITALRVRPVPAVVPTARFSGTSPE